MKRISNFFKQLFVYKKNWFVFILSFFVIFISTFAINLKYSDVKKYETISSYFPDTLLIDNSSMITSVDFSLEEYYKNSNYFKVFNISKEFSEVTNLVLPENQEIDFYGIDNNFFDVGILPSASKYKFEKIDFSSEIKYSEEMFRFYGMFAVIPESLLEVNDIHELKICDRPVNIIGTYSSLFEDDGIKIFLPNTTFLNIFESFYNSIGVTLYVDKTTCGELNTFTLSYTLDKNDILLLTNAYIDLANNSFSLYLALYFVASISICILCVATIKNRYNEIGIKLAIGARKTDIVLEFMTENLMVIFISSLFAFFTSIAACLVFESIETIKTSINCIMIFFPVSIFCLCIYLISSFVFVLIPSLIGVNSNIEKILKEER